MLHFGKKPPTIDGRDWKWETFRTALKAAGKLPTIPADHWGHGNTYKDWLMLANGPDPTAPGAAAEGCGCCVWSSAAHQTMEAHLEKLRALVKKAVPRATEGIVWGMLGYAIDGRPFAAMARQQTYRLGCLLALPRDSPLRQVMCRLLLNP